MRYLTQSLLVVSVVLTLGAQSNADKVRKQKCIGTIFGGPNDKWAGEKYRCIGVSTKTKGVRGVAHRWLPCGTEVTITNKKTGLTTTAPVIDRGPYGALLPKGTKRCPRIYGTKYPKSWCKKRSNGRFWVVKPKRSDPGEWQGCLDMTNVVADDIDHDGWEVVNIQYVLPSRRNRPNT